MTATPSAGARLLADMPRGFADPVHDSQAVFRCVLEALSRPGQLQQLPVAALSLLQAPAPLSTGLTALLLTLLDGETSLHLHPNLDSEPGRMYCRFHTGVKAVDAPSDANFVAVPADQAGAATWRSMQFGSDEAPQQGATLLIDVTSLVPQPALPLENAEPSVCLQLTGPGIETTQRLCVDGLSKAFWKERIAMQPLFPRGADLLLVCGASLVGIPRSTHLTLEA